MSLCLSSQGCAVGEEARTTRVPNANGRITAYCAHVHAIFFSSERFDLVLPVNFSASATLSTASEVAVLPHFDVCLFLSLPKHPKSNISPLPRVTFRAVTVQ